MASPPLELIGGYRLTAYRAWQRTLVMPLYIVDWGLSMLTPLQIRKEILHRRTIHLRERKKDTHTNSDLTKEPVENLIALGIYNQVAALEDNAFKAFTYSSEDE